MLRERQCQENEQTSHRQGTTFGAHISDKGLFKIKNSMQHDSKMDKCMYR